MAVMPGMRGQQRRDHLYDASGIIASGGTAQLLLPEAKERSFLFIQNLDGTSDLYVEFGAARATATISGGKITGFSITNAGMGYTIAPQVELLGGGNGGNSTFLGAGLPGYPAPGDPGDSWPRTTDMSAFKPAQVHATLSAGAVNDIVIEDPGNGYVIAPFVKITNSLLDPYGVAIASATSGIWLTPGGGNLYMDRAVPTDQISIFSTGTPRFVCKWLD